jgi:hypothetical protein
MEISERTFKARILENETSAPSAIPMQEELSVGCGLSSTPTLGNELASEFLYRVGPVSLQEWQELSA